MTSVAVYSCFFGDPEPFNAQAMGAGQDYDRILFTDRHDIKPDGIETRVCSSAALGPLYESRRAKLMPHRMLAGYDWAIYVDNRASLTKTPHEIVAGLGASTKPGRYVYEHPERTRVYDELDVCFRVGHLDETRWRNLDKLYKQHSLPASLTLTHNAVMLYKAGDTKSEIMSEIWFEMFLRYCRRDQLTMQLAEHLAGTPAIRLNGDLSDIATWPVFQPKERSEALNPPGLVKPGGRLSYARLQFKMAKMRRKALISAQQARR